MSMTVLTILQFASAFLAYSFMTFIVPAIVLRKKLTGRKRLERLLIYFLTGNFYMMNLVFVLELLHISYRCTLIAGTFLPVILVYWLCNRMSVKDTVQHTMRTVKRLANRQQKTKSLLLHFFKKAGGYVVRYTKKGAKSFLDHSLEWILFFGIIAGILWMYGTQGLNSYGYTASDIPVHLSWISALCENNLFVDGVYPFGFHCVIYYLHQVFGIDTYVLLRVFGLVQAIYIHLVLFVFLKLCCKSRYLPYAGLILYTFSSYMRDEVYERFYAALPQEFGMLFILPAIYFAFAFFQEKEKKDSRICLAGFAMSFSMTLSVHFYGTMIAGLYCVGIFVGYLFLIFRRKYFLNIVVTVILSVGIAVFPMAAAYVTGTPLQGSLNWGMKVMNGSLDEEADDSEEQQIETELETEQETELETEKKTEIQENTQEVLTDTSVPVEKGFIKKIQRAAEYGKNMLEKIWTAVDTWIFGDVVKLYHLVLLTCMITMFVMGLLYFIIKESRYGAMLISTSVFMVLITILQGAKNIGIPELMDANRCSFYYAYVLPVFLVFTLDCILFLFAKVFRWNGVTTLLSMACVAVLLANMAMEDKVREPLCLPVLETNEAITCITNILREEEDFTWTICSANDEREMIKEHGRHCEMIDLLRKMEDYDGKSAATEPTQTIYFFIEKVPLDYMVSYENSGQTISVRGAMQSLPYSSGLGMYQGENRWIVMSKMYCWAQEFQKLYPDEMTVYMETDRFICYKLKQNTYRLYNLLIDYGYNT